MKKLVLACLALAALAHLLPAEPTYDPWAWIIWGREIADLDLDTRAGPSWKPLPVIFTTVFSLVGDRAAPELWLVVAQAGGLLAFALTFRLAARLAGPVAGAIAALGLVLADEFIRNFARGNSEGLLVAFCLAAVERHLDGHRRQAFLLGVAAGLLRPEVWPFLLLYGVWLMWREPATRLLVVGCGALTLVLWFVPEYLGSGDAFRAAERAREPNPDSAAYAEVPFLETFRRASLILALPLLAGAIVGLVQGWRRREAIVLALAAIATALMIAVAAMTQAGFAGNLRYVALPAALVCVLAGAGWVRLIEAVRARAGTLPAVLAAALLVGLSVPAVRHSLDELDHDLWVVELEAGDYDRLPAAIEKAGGRAAVLACRPIYSPPFETQAIAYALHVHAHEVPVWAAPPGSVVALHRNHLSRDPRFQLVASNTRWAVLRNCPGGTP